MTNKIHNLNAAWKKSPAPNAAAPEWLARLNAPRRDRVKVLELGGDRLVGHQVLEDALRPLVACPERLVDEHEQCLLVVGIEPAGYVLGMRDHHVVVGKERAHVVRQEALASALVAAERRRGCLPLSSPAIFPRCSRSRSRFRLRTDTPTTSVGAAALIRPSGGAGPTSSAPDKGRRR
jgi:hypothetical protein